MTTKPAQRNRRTTGDQGVSGDTAAVRKKKNRAAIQLLKSWRTGDKQEQKATWDYLKKALDEDRLSARKLFP